MFDLNAIRAAEATLQGRLRHTELIHSHYFSERLGYPLFFKCENLQRTGSFKIRGALNFLDNQPAERLQNGLITASAGNHAQGVALAARRRGVDAVIVMPVTTPSIKVDAVRALGGDVVLHGDNYDDAYAHARELEKEHGYYFVHPFDDPDVIAGQGTIGLEILEQAKSEIDAVFVPVGGGGLIAGIAAAIKAVRPDIRIIGVEPEDSAAMQASLQAGHPVTLDHVGIFADGVAVRRVPSRTNLQSNGHINSRDDGVKDLPDKHFILQQR